MPTIAKNNEVVTKGGLIHFAEFCHRHDLPLLYLEIQINTPPPTAPPLAKGRLGGVICIVLNEWVVVFTYRKINTLFLIVLKKTNLHVSTTADKNQLIGERPAEWNKVSKELSINAR